MECSIDLKTPGVKLPADAAVYVSPFSGGARKIGIFSSSTQEQVGQLDLRVSTAVQNGALVPTGQIASVNQYGELNTVRLSFETGASGWTAGFNQLDGSDQFGFRNSIRFEGSVDCHELLRNFAILSTNSNVVPAVLFPKGNLDSELGDGVLAQAGYCVDGDLEEAFRALHATHEITEELLKLNGASGLTYINFRFVCQEIGVRLGEFICQHGTEYPDPVSIPLCRGY